MNMLCKTFMLLLLVNVVISSPVSAGWFNSGSPTETAQSGAAPFATISDMADAMGRELKEGHAGSSLRLYLDRDDIREDQDVRNVPFAALLANELERSFSKTGYVFEGRLIDQADYIVSISYHRTADKVVVYLKLKRTKNDSYRNLKGMYELSLATVPSDLFVENLDNKLVRLTQKVAQSWNKAGTLSLFIAPVVEARRKYSSPFSEYATGKFKANLAAFPLFRLMEEKPVVKSGALRSIKKGTDLAGTDALLVGADAVLEGIYLRGRDSVNVSLTMKDLKGKVLGSAEESIPLEMVLFSLDNDDAETLASIADTENEKTGAVRISTVKGGGYQVFRKGETVSFIIQVTRPLFVYVYDINPNGEVSLLYPKIGEAEQPKQPGLVYTLPDVSDSWEIKVEAPFGKDAVKIFASDRRLPIPGINQQMASRSFNNGTRSLNRVDKVQKELASQSSINGRDIVDYYKGQAARTGAALYESTVYVETRPK